MNSCSKCGGQNAQGAVVCAFCGAQMAGGVNPNTTGAFQPFNQPPNNPQGNQSFSGGTPNTSKGTASFVCGILSLVAVCCFWFAAPILGPIAIVLGILQNKQHQMGKATAGVVMGVIGLVLGIIVGVITIVGMAQGWEIFNFDFDF